MAKLNQAAATSSSSSSSTTADSGFLDSSSPGSILQSYFDLASLDVFDGSTNLAQFVDESWSTDVDSSKFDDPNKISYTQTFTSAENSNFTVKEAVTNSTNSDGILLSASRVDSIAFTGSNKVDKLSVTDKSTQKNSYDKNGYASGDSNVLETSIKFTGSNATASSTTDDVSLTSTNKSSESNTYIRSSDGEHTATKWNYTESASFVYSDAGGKGFNLSLKTSKTDAGTYTVSTDSDSGKTVFTVSNLSYSDAAGVVIKLSGSETVDSVKGTEVASIKSLTLTTSDLSVTSKAFTSDPSADDGFALESFISSLSISEKAVSTFADGTGAGDGAVDYLMARAFGGDNTITIKTANGYSVDSGAGKDAITGGSGNDTIAGGAGSDVLKGGAGADVFVFNIDDYDFTSLKTVATDTVSDFSISDGDKISGLSVDGFYSTLAEAKAANLGENYIYESSTGKIYYDADGISSDSSSAAAFVIVTITGKPTLDGAYFS